MKNLTLRPVLLFINAFFLCSVAFAQGSIEGYIKDMNTNTPQGFIPVQLYGDEGQYAMYTDEDGFYYFDAVKEGSYSLKVMHSDTFALIENVRITNNKTELLSVNASFEKLIGDPEGFTFKVYKDLFVIDKPNVPRIDADKIDNEKPRNPIDIVKRIPSTVETSEGLSFKGSRPGTGVYYIDGIRTYGELYIPMSAVGSIEVYNGGVPAQYGNTTSAVIVVETQSYFDKL